MVTNEGLKNGKYILHWSFTLSTRFIVNIVESHCFFLMFSYIRLHARNFKYNELMTTNYILNWYKNIINKNIYNYIGKYR